jgi:hypothetical protein
VGSSLRCILWYRQQAYPSVLFQFRFQTVVRRETVEDADVDVGRERDQAGCSSASIAVVCYIPKPWPCPGLQQDMSVLRLWSQLLVVMKVSASQLPDRPWHCSLIDSVNDVEWWDHIYMKIVDVTRVGCALFLKLLTQRFAGRDRRKPAETWVADLWV